MIQLDPNSGPSYNALGMITERKGNYNKAISLFEKTLSLIPDSENNHLSSFAYYQLAETYFKTNNYTKALQMLKKAKKLAKGLPEPKPILLL